MITHYIRHNHKQTINHRKHNTTFRHRVYEGHKHTTLTRRNEHTKNQRTPRTTCITIKKEKTAFGTHTISNISVAFYIKCNRYVAFWPKVFKYLMLALSGPVMLLFGSLYFMLLFGFINIRAMFRAVYLCLFWIFLILRSIIVSHRSLCKIYFFHRVLVFLATPMCYIPFERDFDID